MSPPSEVASGWCETTITHRCPAAASWRSSQSACPATTWPPDPPPRRTRSSTITRRLRPDVDRVVEAPRRRAVGEARRSQRIAGARSPRRTSSRARAGSAGTGTVGPRSACLRSRSTSDGCGGPSGEASGPVVSRTPGGRRHALRAGPTARGRRWRATASAASARARRRRARRGRRAPGTTAPRDRRSVNGRTAAASRPGCCGASISGR